MNCDRRGETGLLLQTDLRLALCDEDDCHLVRELEAQSVSK